LQIGCNQFLRIGCNCRNQPQNEKCALWERCLAIPNLTPRRVVEEASCGGKVCTAESNTNEATRLTFWRSAPGGLLEIDNPKADDPFPF
jgi:hypothetical protein